MATLVSRVNDLATRIGTEFKTVYSKIGNLANLTTTAKGDLVSAVNEVKASVGSAGAQIDDSAASSTKTYSSSKTESRLSATSTADRDRGVHTGTQAASTISDFASAADARITAQKGQASGLAPLDSGSKVPAAYLPSYVDDVLEYATQSAFPATGEGGKIYVVTSGADIDKEYRWSGTVYREISPSPGSTDAVPEGATNKYYTSSRATSDAQALLDTKVGDTDSNFVSTFVAALA